MVKEVKHNQYIEVGLNFGLTICFFITKTL